MSTHTTNGLRDRAQAFTSLTTLVGLAGLLATACDVAPPGEEPLSQNTQALSPSDVYWASASGPTLHTKLPTELPPVLRLRYGHQKRAAGRYRVDIVGFRVDRETWDHVTEQDGKRDEVYVDYIVQTADLSGAGLLSHDRTRVIGDTWRNERRHQGGSASDRGGLRTGDTYPGPDPTAMGPRRATDALPLQVWAGELVEGENAVAIMPSIWEWDDYTSRVAEDWTVSIVRVVPALVTAIGQLIGNPAVSAVGGALAVLEPLVERPIGMGVGHSETRPIGLVKEGERFTFRPRVLRLDYHRAEELIRTAEIPGRPGVVPIVFEEDEYYRGKYTLFLSVQRN